MRQAAGMEGLQLPPPATLPPAPSPVHQKLIAVAGQAFAASQSESSNDEANWFRRLTIPHRILSETWQMPVEFNKLDGFADLVGALESDPDLNFIARDDSRMGILVGVPGGVFSRIDKNSVVVALLNNAWRRMALTNASWTVDAYIENVVSNLEDLKRAAVGEKARVTTVLGFAGVRLPEGVVLPTPWGEVQSAPSIGRMDFNMATAMILPLVTEEIIVFNQAPDDIPPYGDVPHIDFNLVERTLALAIAIASVDAELCAPTPTFQVKIHPFFQGFGNSYVEPRRTTEQAIDADAVNVASRWVERLISARHPGLSVAESRIISSISERSQPEDALIDAVTAWEAMLGASTETTFRVTGALTKLLCSDLAERAGMLKKLKKTYGVRSEIVHGVHVDSLKVREASQYAKVVAVKALRSLHDMGDEILSLKDSQTRSEYLMLMVP